MKYVIIQPLRVCYFQSYYFEVNKIVTRKTLNKFTVHSIIDNNNEFQLTEVACQIFTHWLNSYR